MYKIGRPRSGRPIWLITSMITDRLGQHELLLPINHNRDNFQENECFFFFGATAMEYQMSKIRENITGGDTV